MINLNYNNNQKILTIKVEGILTIELIEETMLTMFNSDEYTRDVNTLWDLRDMLFENIDIAFIKRMVFLKKKYDGMRGDAKIAILSNYALAAPIVKLYIILSKGLSQKTRAFKSVEEAELWLSDIL